MAGRKSDFTLTKLDDLFSTQEQRDEEKLSKIRDIPLTEIDDFPDHPFKVRDDEDMAQLIESIKERGVITPATVRQKEDGRYELISGHRRKRACELAGFDTLRCEVVDLNRDEATILMVESNYQRSKILPSEKAFAYKMRLDAMKRQGERNDLTCDPLGDKLAGTKSVMLLADKSDDSKTQIQRYIRLLCYTSPLAFSMGGSKTTSTVFKSWCRMVGSQLLLLVMNVWFLRGFASSMGQFIANGGALTTGKGSIFLWMFCALAYLKCAQRFDSYLASIGLNVAQTGSSMGMELMMAARVISGAGSSVRSAGSVFGRGGNAAATGTGAAANGFASGFASRFSPNSYVRDAVVEGGSRMGFNGGAGFVGRAFGGIAARNGATLNGNSISSVAARAPSTSGTIAGDIADRSLGNYMPQMQGFQLQGTQITGGHISTTAVSADGKSASVDMFNASQFEKPEVPHSVVTAADGSQWYQMASGEGRGAFYDVPTFHGVGADIPNTAAGDGVSGASQPGESGQSFGETLTHDGVEGHPGMVTYPGAADGIGAADTPAPESTLLTGVAASPVGGGDQPPIGYGNGAPSVDTVYGNAPEAQHFGAAYAGGFGESPQNGAQFADHGENVGQGFYSEAPLVAATFPSAPEGTSLRTVGDGVIEASSPDGGNTLWYNSAYYQEPDAPHSVMQSSNGVDWYAMQQQGNIPQFEVGEAAAAYNQAAFQNFMPGYDLPVSQVDGTHRQDGYFEVRHEDGSGTKFYDIARYAAPRGDYQVFEDSRGSQWYAIQGDAAVDRKPVYENGKPVYDNGKLRTTNVETIRYKQTPTRFAEPEKRGDIERKPPKRKM